MTIGDYLLASTTLTECLPAVIRPLISLMDDPRTDQLWSQAWLQRNYPHGLTDIDTMCTNFLLAVSNVNCGSETRSAGCGCYDFSAASFRRTEEKPEPNELVGR